MSELRQNIVTRDWVVIAPARGKRPNDYGSPPANRDKKLPVWREDCPFCPGNENQSPKETHRQGAGTNVIRVVPNLYPAFSLDSDGERGGEGISRSMPGIGVQEVIIEHMRHDMTTALMPVGHIAEIIKVYRARYAQIRRDTRLESIIVFKNHGEGAGTSLVHPHSQLAATPVVPNDVRNRMEAAVRYFDDTGECVFCRTLRDEFAATERIVLKSAHFAAFVPYAALSPFHLWIYPRRHAASFDEITDQEAADLAYVLKGVLARLYYGLNDPDFNYVIRSIPTKEGRASYFHWYLSIIPRTYKTAGFELGSGMYINPAIPEESARFLRNVSVPEEEDET